MEPPTLLRPSRRDALPEHTHYVDTGCDLHPSCLTCPLERCRYDEPGGARRILSKNRDEAIVGMQRQGRPISAIAGRFGISRRTVFRVLARSKQQATSNRQHGKESIRVLERSR
jgi:transposase-like protein